MGARFEGEGWPTIRAHGMHVGKLESELGEMPARCCFGFEEWIPRVRRQNLRPRQGGDPVACLGFAQLVICIQHLVQALEALSLIPVPCFV